MSASSEGPAPTEVSAVQPSKIPTSTPPTLAADYVGAGERAMRSSAAVATAIGTEFETMRVEPVGRYESPVGIAFLVKTPEPVILPTGTLTTGGSGEGVTSSIEPSSGPMGPASYIYVIMKGDFSVPEFLIVPDALAEHDTLVPPTP